MNVCCCFGSDITIESLFNNTSKQILEKKAWGRLILVRPFTKKLEANFGYASEKPRILNSNKSQFLVASLTKILTAIAVIKIVEQKHISLFDPISKFLPASHDW